MTTRHILGFLCLAPFCIISLIIISAVPIMAIMNSSEVAYNTFIICAIVLPALTGIWLLADMGEEENLDPR